MKKGQQAVIRAEYIDAGRKRTPDQQLMAITGMSIDEYVRKLRRNEGGLLDKVALPQ